MSNPPNTLIDPITYPTIETVTTYQGTIAVSNASVALIAANVTMAPNSGACPKVFGRITIRNVGANTANISWFGGTAGASSGCDALTAGSAVTVNLGGSSVAPSFLSASGTTLSFRN